MSKTIVALATPSAHSAIAVVRLSGDAAIEIADSIFQPFYIESIKNLPGYHAAYGNVLQNGKPLDEAVALVFRAPKSYTGENMVELSCHGNPLIAARLVAACIEAGAAPAGAGEFTRRAFENGKLDLSQAEAVAELIESESGLAAAAALDRRSGTLGKQIDDIADGLSFTAAKLAVWSDYPEEEDAPFVTREELIDEFSGAAEKLSALMSGYNTGRLVQNGIRIAVAGSPNVGKSTLTNLLSGSERSIVTDIAGTTRDIVEAAAELDGVSLKLLDKFCSGHFSQAGVPGTQMVAPRSITAWLKSPGRSAGTRAAASPSNRRRTEGMPTFSRMPRNLLTTRITLPSTAGTG